MKKTILFFAILGVFLSLAPVARAASAVAWCSTTKVYGYANNCATEAAAKAAALASARNRGARAPSIISSSEAPGYGAISIWRTPHEGIKAIGAACGAATIEAAYSRAQRECRTAGGGPGPAPRVAWRDTMERR